MAQKYNPIEGRFNFAPDSIASPPASTAKYEIIPISSDGQVLFNLTNLVANASLATLYLNGQKLTLGQHYNVITSGTVIQWITTVYLLEIDDVFELYIP